MTKKETVIVAVLHCFLYTYIIKIPLSEFTLLFMPLQLNSGGIALSDLRFPYFSFFISGKKRVNNCGIYVKQKYHSNQQFKIVYLIAYFLLVLQRYYCNFEHYEPKTDIDHFCHCFICLSIRRCVCASFQDFYLYYIKNK